MDEENDMLEFFSSVRDPGMPPLLHETWSGPVAPERPLGAEEIKLWSKVAGYQAIYSFLGLAIGLAVILVGSGLVIRGVTGATSWTAKILGLESTVSDAGPGTLLFIVGIFIVWVTKFDFRVTRSRAERNRKKLVRRKGGNKLSKRADPSEG